MECERCSFSMEKIDREYHHFCWMCGHVKHYTPSYHIPQRATCFACGEEIDLKPSDNRRARCKPCREKHRDAMRIHRIKKAGTNIAKEKKVEG